MLVELIQRHLETRVKELLGISPIVVIEGARQVGKSTMTKMLLPQTEVRFLTLDDPVTKNLATEDPLLLLQSSGDTPLVIDEVQRAPQLVLALKMLVDRNRQVGKYLLTGSANLLRIPQSEDSLAGRAMTLRLHPFTQGELAGQNDDWVSAITQLAKGGATLLDKQPAALTREEIVKRAAKGGYPPVQHLDEKQQHLWLKDYLKRLLQRDATDLGQLNTKTLTQLFSLLAASPGGELVLQHLADKLSISRETVRRYLELLDSMFLTVELPAWSRSLTTRQVRRPKLYLSDPGLFTTLENLNTAHLLSPQGFDYLGGLIETFVVCELYRQQGWSGTPHELFYYRDRAGAEVDIIIETPSGVIGVEVKASTSVAPKQFKHLQTLRDRLGEQFIAGIVLNLAEPTLVGRKLYSLPINSLWQSPQPASL